MGDDEFWERCGHVGDLRVEDLFLKGEKEGEVEVSFVL